MRGLMQLAASMAPLVRGRGVAGSRERLFLLVVLLAPLGFVALPSRLELPAGLLSTALILVWLFRGRTLRLHGAEHRAIAAAEARSLEGTWSGSLRPSRFSPRCGTNFAALAIPVTTVFDRLAPSVAPCCGRRRVRRRRLDRRHDGALEGGAASLRPAPRPAAARSRAAAADDEGARARGHAGRAPGRCVRASPRALGGRLGREARRSSSPGTRLLPDPGSRRAGRCRVGRTAPSAPCRRAPSRATTISSASSTANVTDQDGGSPPTGSRTPPIPRPATLITRNGCSPPMSISSTP